MGELKQIGAGIILLVLIFLGASLVLSSVSNTNFLEVAGDVFFKVFFPKTGAKSDNPFLSVIYLIIAFISIGLIYFIIENITLLLLKTDFKNVFSNVKMKKIKNHYIIIGGGDVGVNSAKELKEDHIDFIIIEKDPVIAQKLEEDYLVLNGDGLDEAILKQARISESLGIIVSLNSSGDTLFALITIKNLQPDISVACRARDVQILKKLRQAGADFVVMPEIEAANRLVEYVKG